MDLGYSKLSICVTYIIKVYSVWWWQLANIASKILIKCECGCLGLDEIIRATRVMGIPEPGIFFQLCWKYFAIIILIVSLDFKKLQIDRGHISIV